MGLVINELQWKPTGRALREIAPWTAPGDAATPLSILLVELTRG